MSLEVRQGPRHRFNITFVHYAPNETNKKNNFQARDFSTSISNIKA
jgi:hypothetical protein